MKKCGGTLARLGTMLALAPTKAAPPSQFADQETVAPKTPRKGRVAILKGCAQSVLAPSINDATTRLLTRLGYEVVFPKGEGCCGALVHHMGKEEAPTSRPKPTLMRGPMRWKMRGLMP